MSIVRKVGRALFAGAVLVVPLVLLLRARGISRGMRGDGTLTAPTGGAAQVASALVPPALEGGAFELDAIVEDARRYDTHVWSFDLEKYDVTIEDTGMTTALDALAARTDAELVVNGGFFDPDGKAVGIAVSKGTTLSRYSKSLSGGVLTSDGRRAMLFPAEDFTLPEKTMFAVQCRPRLVVDRVANVKSDDGKRAERTALCVRDAGRTLDVIVVRASDDGESAGPSLFALAQHLTAAGCEQALNLDGGPSTGVAWRTADETKSLPPRKPVRHAIAFKAK